MVPPALNTYMNSRSLTSASAPPLNRICARHAPTRLSLFDAPPVIGEGASPQPAATNTAEIAMNNHPAAFFMRFSLSGILTTHCRTRLTCGPANTKAPEKQQKSDDACRCG